MSMFLQVVGAFFLLLIAFAVLAGLVVRARIRKLLEPLKALAEATATPARITLQRVVGATWNDEAEVEALSGALRHLGFEEVGVFTPAEIAGLQLRAWVDARRSLYAVIYEHAQAGVWMDYVALFADGTSLTVSNAPRGGELDHRPGHDKIYAPGLDAAGLLDRMLAERHDRPARPASADDFVPMFERAYAEEMDWRNSRGGPTEREILAIAAASGQEYDADVLASTREMERARAVEQLEEALRDRFARETTLSVAEWEEVRDRLVFVHDRLTSEMIREIFEAWSETGEVPDLDDASASPRAAFAAANARLPGGSRFRKIGELPEPVGADVYRAPE